MTMTMTTFLILKKNMQYIYRYANVRYNSKAMFVQTIPKK